MLEFLLAKPAVGQSQVERPLSFGAGEPLDDREGVIAVRRRP
jgi:hypothetical protein